MRHTKNGSIHLRLGIIRELIYNEISNLFQFIYFLKINVNNKNLIIIIYYNYNKKTQYKTY
jgi:hypothetical protein